MQQPMRFHILAVFVLCLIGDACVAAAAEMPDAAPVIGWLPGKRSPAIIRAFGAVECYSHTGDIAGNQASATGTYSKDQVIVCWRNSHPGFDHDGILSEVRIAPVLEAIPGATIQAWVVRPTDLAAGSFSLVRAIGEIDASVVGRWHVLRGLAIPVRHGDMLAVRGVGVNLPFWTASEQTSVYRNVRVAQPDRTLVAVSDGLPASQPDNGKMWVLEADVLVGDPQQANVPAGLVRLDQAGRVPGGIGQAHETNLRGKTIIWVGTSIALGGAPPYPDRVGEYLDAKVLNEAAGSSGIVWNGTRALSLSATKAELSAAGFDPNQSFEHRIIGRGADLLVLDHGYNDRSDAVDRLGTIDGMDRATFYGAFNAVITAYLTDNSRGRVVFVTPPSRYTREGQEVAQNDAVRAAIIALGEKWGAPVIDLMRLANFNAVNNATRTRDGIHPLQAANEDIAIILASRLSGLQ